MSNHLTCVGRYRGRESLCLAIALLALPLAACATAKTAQPTEATATSVNTAVPTTQSSAEPATSQNLRLVLRSAAEVNAAKQASESPIAQPLAGDLWQVLAIDSPQQLRFVSATDLDQLKLSTGDAVALGLQNALAALPPLPTVTHDLTPHQIGVIQSNADETSRILTAKDWAPLARELDGRLLVAVPDCNTVLYSEENGTQSVRTFAAKARDAAAQAGHAVSPAVLRWTPTGWQPVIVP